MSDIPYIEVNYPKTIPDYSNGKIVEFSSIHSNKVYYSYTALDSNEFENETKKNYIEWKAGRHGFVKYFELIDLGFNDFTMKIIEHYSCNNDSELKTKRNEYINQNPKCMNNDKIPDKYKLPKVKCECGSIVQEVRLYDHYKTQKHQRFISVNQIF